MNPQQTNDENSLLKLLLVIVHYKKMIILTCLVVFVLACGLTLLKPDTYTATARLLPPQENSDGLSANLGGRLGRLASFAGRRAVRQTSEQYIGMLKSRTINDAIIERFDLMKRFKLKVRSSAYKRLATKSNFSFGKDDRILTVSFRDKDPQLAANIVNAYIDELKRLNATINLNNAGRERVFLEDRLKLVKADLTDAEEALKTCQEQNKAIRIEDQASAIISAIAALKGDLASMEVRLGVLLSSQTEKNPEVKALREGIAQVKEQIARMERSPEGKEIPDIFMATSAVPRLGLSYARLLRNLKIQEAIYELLTQQYEVAKISEAKNMSTIQVLDNAVPPDLKSAPNRAFQVIIATFVAGFLSLIIAFIRGLISNLQGEDQQLWEQIRFHMALRKRR